MTDGRILASSTPPSRFDEFGSPLIIFVLPFINAGYAVKFCKMCSAWSSLLLSSSFLSASRLLIVLSPSPC